MTRRHLNIYMTVCDEGSMTGAAEKLYISQPSVSQAINELEEHYGVKLFERLGKRLYITQGGERLLTYARHITNLYNEAEQEMREIKSGGVLRIGASITIGTYVLFDIIKEFKRLKPDIAIEIIVDNTTVIEGMIFKDEIDFGLVEGAVHSFDLTVSPFMEDELILICSPVRPWANSKVVRTEDIEDEGFIVREEGSGTRELFESVMASHNVKWRKTAVLNNAESIKNAVAADIGISVISKIAVIKELEKGELASVKLEDMKFMRYFSIIHHKNKFISEGMKSFFELCKNF